MATKKKVLPVGNSRSNSAFILWLGIAAIIVLLDQVTKITITRLFSYAETLSVTSFFNLTLVYNKGAAFSFLAAESGWQRYFFTALGLGASAYIKIGRAHV